MRYMTAYPDLFHHPTEDLVFRQLMLRAAETRAKVERLVSEHETIGVAGSDLLQELKKTIRHDAEPSSGLIKAGWGYVTQLRTHMNTEEGEIFPLTKVVLTSPRLARPATKRSPQPATRCSAHKCRGAIRTWPGPNDAIRSPHKPRRGQSSTA